MESIFNKEVPLVFKGAEREERRGVVQFNISLQCNKHDSKKELVVRLTDDQDLLFLYTLRLAEDDFHSLKMQQGLLVDFTAFPQKFVDLLDMCMKERSKENPKFVIHFVSSGGSVLREDAPCTLNIMEMNAFRHLNHLSLKFLPGTDADVKSHLANCLKELKQANNQMQFRYEHTTEDLSNQLQETQKVLATKTAELETLKLEWSSRTAEIVSKHKEDMAVEKEKAVQLQTNLQKKSEQERRELEQNHMKVIKQLQARLEECESVNKGLTDLKYKSESSIKDYKSKLAVLQDDCNRMRDELHSLKKENVAADQTCQEKEKYVRDLNTRVAVLEQELKDKAVLLTKSDDLLVLEKAEKKHLETELDSRKKEIGKLEAKVKAMAEELKKGNEIIKKLQGSIKSYHEKAKIGSKIAAEQEKLLVVKNAELEKLRQELATVKDKLRETEDQNQRLNTNLETATQKLEESRKLLATNEAMILWLNKQINEQRIGQNHVGNFEFPSSSSNLLPRTSAVHNFSSSSHGSVPTQDNYRLQTQQRAVVPPALGGQLHQNDHQSKRILAGAQLGKSSIPIAQNQVRTSPVAQNAFSSNGEDKEQNPPLDPKFLTKNEEAIPVRGLHSYGNNVKSAATALSLPVSVAATSDLTKQSSLPAAGHAAHYSAQPHFTVPKTENGAIKLGQQIPVSRQQPPLVSAYFPGHS